MKQRYLIFTILCMSIFLIHSCVGEKETDFNEKAFPEYDSEKQVIYYKKQLNQDVKSDIIVAYDGDSHTPNIACQFSFFNYGDDIRLFNGCRDDYFVTGLGEINIVHALSEDDEICIESKSDNEKYGDWGIANISILNGKYSFDNVYMTPLSLKNYNDEKNKNLIFIQFVSNNKYMNVLFNSGPTEYIIAKYYSNTIIPRSDFEYNIDAPQSGPGQFWHIDNND